MEKLRRVARIVGMPAESDALGTLFVSVFKVVYGIVPFLRIAFMAAFIENVQRFISGTDAFNALYAVLFFLVIFYEQSFSAIENLASVRLKNNIWNKFSIRIIEKWSHVKYEYTENKEIYALFMRVKDKVDKQIYDNFSALIAFTATAINIFVLLIYFFNTQVVAGSILTGLFAALVIVSICGGKIQYKASVEMKKARMQQLYFEDVLTGKNSVKERSVFGFCSQIESFWKKHFKYFVKTRMSAYCKFMAGFESVHVGITIISLVMIFIFSVMIVKGELTTGIYIALVTNIVTLIRSFSSSIDVNMRALVSASNFVMDYEYLMKLQADILVSDKVDFSVLEMQDVKFKYPNAEKNTLDGVNFRIEKGKSYALIGANGAGKTTLIKILTGLYRNYEGHIFVDGQELRDNPQYYNLFNTLFQDFAHYNICLKDYLTMGMNCGSVTDDVIVKYLDAYGLNYLLEKLPFGLETILGKDIENGMELSGGEWQKLALVRSACSNRVVKIYDEPTASLDPVSESAVYETVFNNREDNTVLIVSHRLGLTKLVDEIIVLSNGKVLERGSQNYLLEKNGLFSEMYNEQKVWYE